MLLSNRKRFLFIVTINKTLNKVANKILNKIPNKSPNKIPNKPPNKILNKIPNKIPHKIQNQPSSQIPFEVFAPTYHKPTPTVKLKKKKKKIHSKYKYLIPRVHDKSTHRSDLILETRFQCTSTKRRFSCLLPWTELRFNASINLINASSRLHAR